MGSTILFNIGDIIIAWSGDGNWSLRECNLPSKSKAGTWFLDNYLDEVPDWHDGEGPVRYGSFLNEDGSLAAVTYDLSTYLIPRVLALISFIRLLSYLIVLFLIYFM